MDKKPYKVAFLTSMPIVDQAPLFKKMGADPTIEVTVYFCSGAGVTTPLREEEFGIEITWGNTLLEGYRHVFLRNISPRPSLSFFGMINAGILAELARHRYDAIIVHGYSYLTCWLAYLGALLTGTKIFFRGEAVVRPNRSLALRIAKYVVFRPLFAMMHAFLSMGSWSENFYRHYGVPARKIFFTPSAVDNETLIREHDALSKQRNALRAGMKIGADDVVVVVVGKLIGRKRPFDVLRAFEKLASMTAKPCHLVFVGDGAARTELEQEVATRAIKNIHFTGFVKPELISRFYALADIFVLPSDSAEVCPIVINEAMCFGLPIVLSSAIPSALDFVRPGTNGYLFELGNVDQLAAALVALAENSEKRKNFGRESLRIIAPYTYDNDVLGILKALRA